MRGTVPRGNVISKTGRGVVMRRISGADVLNLAAPHTWAASVMPSVLALAAAYRRQGRVDPVMAVCLLLVAVLMQSAVNALNDYADYVKGTDTLDNSPESFDAVIVHGMNPKTARNLGIAFLGLAFVPGLYAVLRRGAPLLVIGLIGAAIVVLYSFGKTPISYLPLGELISGLVMGGLIPLAGVYMQLGRMEYSVLITALPIILGIAMIMFSNNGCDIERDLPAGRRTLPCVLGRPRTDKAYRFALILWAASPLLLFLAEGRYTSLLVYLLELPVFMSAVIRQMKLRLGDKARMAVMGGINNLVICLGFAYMLAYMFHE